MRSSCVLVPVLLPSGLAGSDAPVAALLRDLCLKSTASRGAASCPFHLLCSSLVEVGSLLESILFCLRVRFLLGAIFLDGISPFPSEAPGWQRPTGPS